MSRVWQRSITKKTNHVRVVQMCFYSLTAETNCDHIKMSQTAASSASDEGGDVDQRSWIHVFRNTSGDVDEDKCSQQGTSWKWFHCGVRGVSYSIYEGIPPRPSCPWFAERSQQNEWKLQWCLDLQGTAVVSSPTHQPAALSRRRRRRLSFITSLKLWALRWGAQKRLNCKQEFRSALPAETPPWPTCPSCPERITAAGRTAVERGNALTPGTADGSVESNSVSVFRNWNSVVYLRK